MFSKRIFEIEFTAALNEELDRRNMTVRELSEQTGIPVSTLYKVTLGQRDPRLSTVKKIVSVFEPERHRFIAVIAAKFLLDSVTTREVESGGRHLPLRVTLPIPSMNASLRLPGRKRTGHRGSSAPRSLLRS